MPSVCGSSRKLEKQSSSAESLPVFTEKHTAETCKASEVPGVNLCLSIVDKKIRNLEKRKSKLDDYKVRSAMGEELIKDQLEALAKYDMVSQSLEIANDFKKQFQSVEVEKDSEAMTSHISVQDISELLRIQSYLSLLEYLEWDVAKIIKVFHDMTESDVTRMKELYEWMRLPHIGDDRFDTKLTTAATNISNLLNGTLDENDHICYEDIQKIISKMTHNEFNNGNSTKDFIFRNSMANITGEIDVKRIWSEPRFNGKSTKNAESKHDVDLNNENDDEDLGYSRNGVRKISTGTQIISNGGSLVDEQCSSSITSSLSSDVTADETASISSQVNGGETVQQARETQEKDARDIVSAIEGSYHFLQDSEIDNNANHVKKIVEDVTNDCLPSNDVESVRCNSQANSTADPSSDAINEGINGSTLAYEEAQNDYSANVDPVCEAYPVQIPVSEYPVSVSQYAVSMSEYPVPVSEYPVQMPQYHDPGNAGQFVPVPFPNQCAPSQAYIPPYPAPPMHYTSGYVYAAPTSSLPSSGYVPMAPVDCYENGSSKQVDSTRCDEEFNVMHINEEMYMYGDFPPLNGEVFQNGKVFSMNPNAVEFRSRFYPDSMDRGSMHTPSGEVMGPEQFPGAHHEINEHQQQTYRIKEIAPHMIEKPPRFCQLEQQQLARLKSRGESTFHYNKGGFYKVRQEDKQRPGGYDNSSIRQRYDNNGYQTSNRIDYTNDETRPDDTSYNKTYTRHSDTSYNRYNDSRQPA